MPADIILYALIAAGLIFWLKSILGTDSEEDQNQPDGDKKDDSILPPFLQDKKEDAPSSNVVSLNRGIGSGFMLPSHVRIDNKTAENRLEGIAKEYPEFDLTQFVSGAEYAFSMIIEAFAQGDRETLQSLLTPHVYEAFDKAITAREERGETVTTTIQSVEKIDIQEAKVEEGKFFITTRFVAKEICVIRDKDGEILSGDPDQQTEMNDIWVFTKDVDSDGPEWFLHETRDGDVTEEHKTPVPDSES